MTKENKISKFMEKQFTNEMLNDTVKYQKIYGFEIGENGSDWNNESDAFRHAYMQAMLALKSGQNIAKHFGDRHEDQGKNRGQDPREYNMDLWNNQQGREIAEEMLKEYGQQIRTNSKRNDIIAEKVVQRMFTGQLITNPYTDTRKFEEYDKNKNHNEILEGYVSNSDDHIFTREEIDKMSDEEYLNNEPIIMQQLKEGKIRSGAPAPDYQAYVNPITNKNLIYTKEDINTMSDTEYEKHEKAIYAQMNTIGIPSQKSLSNNVSTFSKTKQNYNNTDGHWVTINGNHVLLED